MQGGFSFVSAVFLFVVGLADEVVASDVEGGVGGVEGGFEGGTELVIEEEGAEEDAGIIELATGPVGVSHDIIVCEFAELFGNFYSSLFVEIRN